MASLEEYRKRGTFDVPALRLLLDGKEAVALKYQIWDTFAKDPLFAPPSHELTTDQLEELTFKRMKRMTEYDFEVSPVAPSALMTATIAYDFSLTLQIGLNNVLFAVTIETSGNADLQKYSEAAKRLEIYGCFAITEMSHGSNAKGIGTTATYDPATQEFELHTPDMEHMKFWIGNLGTLATHAVVFAQLHTAADNKCHGVYPFLVPIRDPMTLQPHSGVLVGSIGKKIGVNGVANGFLAFHNYRIPGENLLTTKGKFTADGRYVYAHKGSKPQHDMAYSTLSIERVGAVVSSATILRSAISIAIRYSAVRRQFGPSPGVELPVIEYQLQQWRLFPYLCAAYAFSHCGNVIILEVVQLIANAMMSPGTPDIEEQGREIHALSCACKAVAGFTTQAAIQECREACGGHGYLAVNQLGNLRSGHDSELTFGGDNNVILIQTVNYLLGWASVKEKGHSIHSPLGSVDCLDRCSDILCYQFCRKSSTTMLTSEDAAEAYRWLLCYLWVQTQQKVNSALASGKGDFYAKEDSLVFYGRTLALVYGELFTATKFMEFVASVPEEKGMKSVCAKLCSLYTLWSLQQHEGDLYQGGYFSERHHSKLLHDSILSLCSELKDEAVSLVDVIAPPDHILQSPIGLSNGEVYKNLYQAIVTSPQALERPLWWMEAADRPIIGSRHHQIVPPPSKL